MRCITPFSKSMSVNAIFAGKLADSCTNQYVVGLLICMYFGVKNFFLLYLPSQKFAFLTTVRLIPSNRVSKVLVFSHISLVIKPLEACVCANMSSIVVGSTVPNALLFGTNKVTYVRVVYISAVEFFMSPTHLKVQLEYEPLLSNSGSFFQTNLLPLCTPALLELCSYQLVKLILYVHREILNICQ